MPTKYKYPNLAELAEEVVMNDGFNYCYPAALADLLLLIAQGKMEFAEEHAKEMTRSIFNGGADRRTQKVLDYTSREARIKEEEVDQDWP